MLSRWPLLAFRAARIALAGFEPDLRLRFFASTREVNHDMLDKLIHYDPARTMAFIAVDERSRKMLGSCACMMTHAERTPNSPLRHT